MNADPIRLSQSGRLKYVDAHVAANCAFAISAQLGLHREVAVVLQQNGGRQILMLPVLFCLKT
jgi:hypothetical protein